MVDPLPFERHLDALELAAAALAEHSRAAGMSAPVDTCPGWSVADLLAHQGMVHRWAAANLRKDSADTPSEAQILEEVPPDELVDWVVAGAVELLETFRSVEPEVDATVFLDDAPRPREFWARRQAHETTIHSVDALSAQLGRCPVADEVDLERELCLDGVDELLTGFLTRGRSKLEEEAPVAIAVAPTDSDRGWTLYVSQGRLVTERRLTGRADATFAGTARQLYLGLWNRGTEITATGRTDLLARWGTAHRVRWS